jgi:hypothetical protein
MAIELVSVVERVAAADVAGLDRVGLEAMSRELGRIGSWVESRRLAVARRLGELTSFVEPVLSSAERVSGREAQRLVRRAGAVAAVPGFMSALEVGAVSPAHVEVLSAGVGRLAVEDRAKLVAEADRLVAAASVQTPEQFSATVRRTVDRLGAGRDAMERLRLQRSASTLRHWVDSETGMVCIRAELDPERGLQLVGRIENAVETLFHDAVPEGCPTDDRKLGHLQAMALLSLTEGRGRGRRHPGRPAVVVVADERTVDDGWHPDTVIDTGSTAELPVEVVQRWARDGERIDVTVRDGIVTSVDGDRDLDAGRSRRLASWKQRMALLVMHPTCGIPDCPVRAKHCAPHHVRWWRHHGRTDLGNLLPVCDRHHHEIHDHGAIVTLDPVTRAVTYTPPPCAHSPP